MTKQDFFDQLRRRLSGLPQDDIEERLVFYNEMIDDRMDDGLSEEEAISATGSVDEIVAQILSETPFSKVVKDRIKTKRRLKTGETLLLVLGCPIWLSLGVAAVAVILALYILLWAAIVSLWAVFGSTVGCSFGCVVSGIVFTCNGNALAGVAMIGAGLVCAGLSILAFYGCKTVTKGILLLTKKFVVWIKNLFIKTEEEK